MTPLIRLAINYQRWHTAIAYSLVTYKHNPYVDII